MAKSRSPRGRRSLLSKDVIKKMDKMNYIDKPALSSYIGVSVRTIDQWLANGKRLQQEEEDGVTIVKEDKLYIDFLLKYTEVKERPFDLFDKHVLNDIAFAENPRLAFDIAKSFYPDRFADKRQIEVTEGDPFKDMTTEDIERKLGEFDIE